MTTRAVAAEARAAGVRTLADRPSQRRRSENATGYGAPAAPLERNALEVTERGTLVPGYASITETPYEMYDAFGPYVEVVSRGAFDKTLGANPKVEFNVNHGAGGGLPMASTRNGTLDLSADDTGLRYHAYVDGSGARSDVTNMLKAVERGDLAESSFKFRIESGVWSPDYTEYRINAVDLRGGDVSAVNFGANPEAYVGRAAEPVQDVTRLRALITAALTE